MTGYITALPAASTLLGGELIEVAQRSTTVTITATTISAAASDNSFNDSADGFVAAGFAVSDRVVVTGFTGDVANNLLVGTVTALTAGKMTIGGNDGDVIVDDAAGESVTITKWVSVRATMSDLFVLANGGGAPLVTETGTTYDLDAADVGSYIRFTNTAAKTLTVRDESDHALPEDGEWHIRNVGTSDLTIVEDTAVTVTPPSAGTLVVPTGGTVTLKRVAADEFDLFGVTVPA
jgi:hypothetical protein